MYIQILVTIFAILMIIGLFKRFKKKLITIDRLLIWSIVWLILVFIFWAPESTSYIANIFGIGRGADLVIYVSIIAIFYMMFKLYLTIDKINNQITKIVRKIGLEQENKKKN